MSFAILDGGTFYHHAAIHGARYRDLFDKVDLYARTRAGHLEEVSFLIVPDRINPNVGSRRRDISSILPKGGHTGGARGKPGGHLVAGVTWTSRPTNFWWWLQKDAKPQQRLVTPDHELFQAVPFASTIWHFHGVLTRRQELKR